VSLASCLIRDRLFGVESSREINCIDTEKSAGLTFVLLSYSLQFQDQEFGSLSGARIIRIATHPNFQRVNNISRFCLIL